MRLLPPLIVWLLWTSVAVAGPARSDTPPDARGDATTIVLNVPYLPQTERLCGGAAAAMVLRYWGERHVDPQEFAPLVDEHAGGIANTVLVHALRNRHWQVTQLPGSVNAIIDELLAGHPLILLLEEHAGRFHYVVVTGADADRVWVHDPTWGPSRPLTHEALNHSWRGSGFWMLRVEPDTHVIPSPVLSPVLSTGTLEASRPQTFCERELTNSLEGNDLDRMSERLVALSSQCPHSSSVLGELAGVRFAQSRFGEAAQLARRAIDGNAANRYAWDVLGSSLFLEDEPEAALRAWNHIEKPRLDSVRIDGLSRTRYSLVTQGLSLSPGDVLTAERYRLTERRLHDLPDVLSSRISYRPDQDGFTTLDVVLVERVHRPSGLIEWTSTAAQTWANREVRATLPGWSGAGSVWNANWRWLDGQPRVELTFAAPRTGTLSGIWHVKGLWEKETYVTSAAGFTRETHARAEVGAANWLTSSVRYGVDAGVDSLNAQSRAISLGGSLERRWLNDQVSLTGALHNWISLVEHSKGFQAASAHASLRSSAEPQGVMHLVDVDFGVVDGDAPRVYWPGAGDGRTRVDLLRAHPLVHDGVVDGPAFGRGLLSMTVESQRWFDHPAITPIGAAVFADVARAWHRSPGDINDPFQVDLGVGVRMRAPGHEGTFRIDLAHGLRDGNNALTVGWLSSFPNP